MENREQLPSPQVNRPDLSLVEYADFLPELPDFTGEVVSLTEQRKFDCKRGDITESLVEMSDGTLYPVVVGIPGKDRLQSDTAVVFPTAWLTSTKGHNRRTMMRSMQIGYPTIMIGPEGEETNHNISRFERFKLAASTSLPKISHDMNRVLDEVIPGQEIRPDEIITLGESLGAMLAPGLNIEQYTQRRAVYGDLTAPCFPRAPKLGELPNALAQLAKEAPALGKLALQLPFQARGRHYVGTIHKNPEYYLQQPLKMLQLMNGDAGILARAARPNTPMHIRIFKNDGWSQGPEWKDIYQGQEEWIYTEEAEGLHLDIADESTLDNIELRLQALSEARGRDGSFKSVDFKPIIALHKEAKSRRDQPASSRLSAAA